MRFHGAVRLVTRSSDNDSQLRDPVRSLDTTTSASRTPARDCEVSERPGPGTRADGHAPAAVEERRDPELRDRCARANARSNRADGGEARARVPAVYAAWRRCRTRLATNRTIARTMQTMKKKPRRSLPNAKPAMSRATPTAAMTNESERRLTGGDTTDRRDPVQAPIFAPPAVGGLPRRMWGRCDSGDLARSPLSLRRRT
jgi:hypothetical protein